MTDELHVAIKAARQDTNDSVYYKDPFDEYYRGPRNKNGHNLAAKGVGVLFRLLD
ncbi:MAG: hypothetical protein KKA91_14070 [Alphaproteobacteria bacterium]|nr:hypothetical protein [Alphaproteobacteria bacterium]MBU4050820.1 hypothetical protein [Alphaproteobacteria bacterium]MBU4155541.1 hypothetical protein [Alphaproteobacteria bacterium]